MLYQVAQQHPWEMGIIFSWLLGCQEEDQAWQSICSGTAEMPVGSGAMAL